jgi:hypothetical protein
MRWKILKTCSVLSLDAKLTLELNFPWNVQRATNGITEVALMCHAKLHIQWNIKV